MTARISVNGELRVHGREVEILVKPRWTHADLDTAESLAGAPVRITIEPVPAPPEPLTGTDADINVRVRVRLDCGLPHLAGRTGTLMRYSPDGLAEVLFDDRHVLATTLKSIERAPASCPHCGASQVTR